MACPERRQDLTSDLLTPSLTLLELCVHIYLFLNSIRIRMAGLLRLRDWYLGDRCGILWSPLYVCAFAYLQNRRLTHKLNISPRPPLPFSGFLYVFLIKVFHFLPADPERASGAAAKCLMLLAPGPPLFGSGMCSTLSPCRPAVAGK